METDLHRAPGTGDTTEAERFANQYKQTLRSYKWYFGVATDPNYWPRTREWEIETPRARLWQQEPLSTNRGEIIFLFLVFVSYVSLAIMKLNAMIVLPEWIYGFDYFIVPAAVIALLKIFVGDGTTTCPACLRSEMESTDRQAEQSAWEPTLFESRCGYCGHTQWDEGSGCG